MILPGHILPYSGNTIYAGKKYFVDTVGSTCKVSVVDTDNTINIKFYLTSDKEILSSKIKILNDRVFLCILHNVHTYNNYDFGPNLICSTMPYFFKFSLNMNLEATSRPVSIEGNTYRIENDTTEIVVLSNDFLETIDKTAERLIIPYFNVNGVGHIKTYDFNLTQETETVLNQQYDLYNRPGVRIMSDGSVAIVGTPYISEQNRDSALIGITTTLSEFTGERVIFKKTGPTWIKIDTHESSVSLPIVRATSTKSNFCNFTQQESGSSCLMRVKNYSENISLEKAQDAGSVSFTIEKDLFIYVYDSTKNIITATKYFNKYKDSQVFTYKTEEPSLYLWGLNRDAPKYQYAFYVDSDSFLHISRYDIDQLSIETVFASIELEDSSAVLKSVIYTNGLYQCIFTTDTGILINSLSTNDSTFVKEAYATLTGNYSNAVVIHANNNVLTIGCSKTNEYLDIIKTTYSGFIQAETQLSLENTEIYVAASNTCTAAVSVTYDEETEMYTQKFIVFNDDMTPSEILQYSDIYPYIGGIACTDSKVITSMSEYIDENQAKIYLIETTNSGQLTNLTYYTKDECEASYRSCDFCLIGDTNTTKNISYTGYGNGKYSNSCIAFW